MQFGIGNNLITAATEVLMVDGARLLKLEQRDLLLASINVWDERGEHIGKLTRGAWSFKSDDLDISTDPNALVLKRRESIIIELLRPEPDYLWLRQADLYSANGVRVRIAPYVDQSGGDLEILEGDQLLASFHHCAFHIPLTVIDVHDGDNIKLAGNGISVGKHAPGGLRVERSTFGVSRPS